MASHLPFFVHGLQYGEGSNAPVLPIMANPAQLRELVVAAPGLVSRMKSYDKAAWEQLQQAQGFVTLSTEELHRFKRAFETACEALTNLPEEATEAQRKEAADNVEKVIRAAKNALQVHVEALYNPVLHDMDHNYLPLPEELPLKTFRKTEVKLLGELYAQKKIKDMPAWATGLVIAGSHNASLNFTKAKKNWLRKLSEWGWLIDAAIVAIGAGIVAGLGAMTPIGWVIAGAMLLTTFVDKWQGIDSKGSRLLEWARRTWHGDYNRKNSVRQSNWRSWKPYLALGSIGVVLFVVGMAGFKLFNSAMSLTHAVFAGLYAFCAATFSLSSFIAGFNKAFREIDMSLWFSKVRDYSEPEMNKVKNAADHVIHEAMTQPFANEQERLAFEAAHLANENALLQQALFNAGIMAQTVETEGCELEDQPLLTASVLDEQEEELIAPPAAFVPALQGSRQRSVELEESAQSTASNSVSDLATSVTRRRVGGCCGGASA